VKRRLSLRGRMVMTAVVATAVVLGVLLLVASPLLERRARDDAFASLTAESRLMARVVEDALARGTPGDELDSLVDAAAREVDARVTIIGTDGRVLADSSTSGAELQAVENHGGRSEVVGALAGRVSRAERVSATVGVRLLYAAVPIHGAGGVVGVARLSRGIERIEAQGKALWRSAALAGLVALAASGLVSLLLSLGLGRSLGEIMETARQLASGNLAARIRVSREDELGELARIINRSADELQLRLAEIARDRGRTDAILSAMDDGVLAVDHQGKVTLANPSLTHAMAMSSPLGRHYLETIRQPEVGTLVEQVLRSGERRSVEVEILALRRSFTVTGVPFPGVEGARHGAVLTFNDTTERQRLDAMRRDFVANASHELRTPLTSIRGFVEALEDGAKDEPGTAERFLGKIRTHADRMAALVEDLLELSRLESGARVPEPDQTRPGEVAAEVVASFAELAARKPLTLRHEARGDVTLATDRERLRRILENLVDNAVKYTPTGGSVVVTTTADPNGGARIEVRDDGPGIEAEHRERVFERFYRVDKARSRELGGTGLGLAIVKHLAESIGAQVTLESEPGRGSIFTVRLPPAS
jgi:two-component system, OmpR family, phosphate regulon sensor histidine kinase PhoR